MTAYKQRLEAGDYAPAPSTDDLEELKLTDLRAELSNRGLPTSGNKQELIDRLAQPQTQNETETPT